MVEQYHEPHGPRISLRMTHVKMVNVNKNIKSRDKGLPHVLCANMPTQLYVHAHMGIA